MGMETSNLIQALIDRGVVIPAPGSVVVEDVDPERIEPGVVLHPGCTLCGSDTCLGRGTQLGRAGGGWFENVRTGRDVDLYGGYVKDAVFLDGVVVRGHAEMRAGTLMEEESEAAHHVGYKMTITMPWVIAGSLVNFCDALVAGGRGRKDHTEIGSAIALYNFTPRGDKFASLFGDVPRGVFLQEPRIFVGGQTQIVSPVTVGYGAVLAAGSSVRRSVPDGALHGDIAPVLAREFDAEQYGALEQPVERTVEYVANLWALDVWYAQVRLVGVEAREHRDPHSAELYGAARAQVQAGIAERVKRLGKIVGKLSRSVERHRLAAIRADRVGKARYEQRIAQHEAWMAAWPRIKAALETDPVTAREAFPDTLGARFAAHNAGVGRTDYLGFVTGELQDKDVTQGQAALQRVVDAVVESADLGAVGP